MKNSKADLFPILIETIPAIRTKDGGAFFYWKEFRIEINSFCHQMLNAIDGTMTLRDLVSANSWDYYSIRDLLDKFTYLGITKYNDSRSVQINKCWIKTSRMIAVSIEIIQKCNQNCLRCYLTGTKEEKEQLNLDELDSLFKDIYSYGIPSITLSGGEPFMREDIFGIIKRAQKHKIQVFIATNGTLLTKSLIRKLKHVGILGLQISVDGLQSTHDHIRQSPGAFNKLKNVFKDCSSNGIPAYAITGINNENIKELPSLNNTLCGWAASGHQLVRYVPSGTVADTFKCAKSDEFKEILTELRNNMSLPIVSCDPIINMYLGRQYLCGAGYYSAAITTDGFIKVCDTLPKFIGDVRKERFGSIVERSQFISEITLRNQNYLTNPSLCDSSRFGCISYQLLASDTLDSQDIYHPNVKLNHLLSIDLKPNEDLKVPFVQEIS